MLDLILLAVGLGFFALSIAYAFGCRAPLRRVPMLLEYILGGVVTAALLVYLTYALLRPEKF